MRQGLKHYGSSSRPVVPDSQVEITRRVMAPNFSIINVGYSPNPSFESRPIAIGCPIQVRYFRRKPGLFDSHDPRSRARLRHSKGVLVWYAHCLIGG
jgi:hypothetical protein